MRGNCGCGGIVDASATESWVVVVVVLEAVDVGDARVSLQ